MRIIPEIHIPERHIDKCDKCDYCRYDGWYSEQTDSGWDCHHPNNGKVLARRLVNDGGPDMYSKEIPIPEWCPLAILPDTQEGV